MKRTTDSERLRRSPRSAVARERELRSSPATAAQVLQFHHYNSWPFHQAHDWDPYEILSALGAGGMGEVYRAQDTRLGREVAVKVLPSTVAGNREALQRFRQEAQSASAINHPNIITIYDIVCIESVSYIAMELIEGRSLRQILSEGPIPINDLLSIAVQVADGLAAAHRSGIVHRDLKPENIMISMQGLAKILDFGVAKPNIAVCASRQTTAITMAGPVTMAGAILGTVGYMSPQQASGQMWTFGPINSPSGLSCTRWPQAGALSRRRQA